MATALLGGVIGILMGVLAMWAMRPSTDRPDSEDARPANTLPSGMDSLLTVLSSSGVVLDAGDHVVKSSPSAHAQGLVRGDELVHPELRQLSRQVRRDREIRGAELALPRGPLGHGRSFVKARVAPLDDDHVLLLIDDLSRLHLDRRRAELLLAVLTEREQRCAVASAADAPFSSLRKTFTDPRLCAAIVDRLTFGGHVIDTGDRAYRR